MSIAWIKIMPVRPADPHRGGAAVGLLDELPAFERPAIVLFRQWCAGETHCRALADDFAALFGMIRANEVVDHLAHLVTLLVHHGRRPIMRHDGHCTCFGGDENVFAQMLAAAAAEDREDAMAFALTLMPPAVAFEAVQTAAPFGKALHHLLRSLSAGPGGALPRVVRL